MPTTIDRDTSQPRTTSLRGVVQLGLPTVVTPEEVAREKSLGGAIDLCVKVAGFDLDKQLTAALHFDKAQFSRWVSGQEGVTWTKLKMVMQHCGNDAPVLWMAHDAGYGLHAMRKRETELQQELRHAREENAALRRVLMGASS